MQKKLLSGCLAVNGMLVLIAVAVFTGSSWLRKGITHQHDIAFVYALDGWTSVDVIASDGSHRASLAGMNTSSASLFGLKGLETDLGIDLIRISRVQGTVWIREGAEIGFIRYDPERACTDFVRMELVDRKLQRGDCQGINIRQVSEAYDWSADGSRLAYQDSRSLLEVSVDDASGRNTENFRVSGNIWGLAWSPAADRLAMTVDSAASLAIYEDGKITEFSFAAPALGRPAWTTDGSRVAVLCGWILVEINLCMLDLNTGQMSRIVFPPDFPVIKSSPSWSPDGRWLAFTAVMPSGFNDIFLFDPTGGLSVRITDDPAADSWPAWSPDSTRIAFVSNRTGNWELYTIHLDGSGLLRLTDTPGDELRPAWLP